MKGIALACVLVFIDAGQLRGVTAGKPTMLPQGKEILIQEGDELRIECQGEGRIQFATQTLIVDVERSNFSITEDEDSGRYTFIRPRTMSADTGWYACADESIQIRNDEKMIDHTSDDISWIYVYVNSSIPFAVMRAIYDIIPVMAGSNAVIPCRPTSPGLEVVLHGETSQGELIPRPQFDPRIGFILDEVDERQNFENFLCLLRGSGEWDRNDWPRYTLHVADPKPLENPVINEDELSHVVWGKDVTLDCRITVPALTRFHLKWQIPDSVSKDRLVQHQMEQVDKLPAKAIWHKELTITQVQPSDAGEYICVAMGIVGNTARSSTKLQIWDPNPLENPVINEQELRHVVRGKDVTLDCRITVPALTSIHLRWQTPDSVSENRLLNGPMQFVNGSSVRETWKIESTIKNVQLSDAGKYICVAKDLVGNTTTSSTTVKVWDPVEISSPRPPLNPDPENERETSHENANANSDTSLLQLLRICLTKQIQAAEAQERAAISQERASRVLEQFIARLVRQPSMWSNTN